MSLLAYAGPATLAIMAFNALVVALTDVYDGSGHDLLRLLGLPSPVRAVLYALLSLGGVAALWMQRRNADLAFVGAVAVVCLWAYTAFALVVHGEDPAGDDACSRTTLYRAGFFAILGGMSLTYAIAVSLRSLGSARRWPASTAPLTPRTGATSTRGGTIGR